MRKFHLAPSLNFFFLQTSSQARKGTLISCESPFNHLHQRSTSTHRKCKATSNSGKSTLQPPAIGSFVSNQMAENKRKSENFKRCSKLESPFRRDLVFPPKETSFNCIPFEKSLEGIQQSHICRLKIIIMLFLGTRVPTSHYSPRRPMILMH